MKNSTTHLKERTQAERTRAPMAAIIRNVPKGYHWGWYSREDPRMHLQTVDGKHKFKVWLEDNGSRIFEPVGKIPSAVLRSLAEEVSAHRTFVEDNWVRHMIHKGWLQMHIALPEVTIVAYPSYGHRFIRKVDLRTDITEQSLATLRPDIIALNEEMGSLRLWTDRPEERAFDIRLSTILWQD